MSVCLWPVRQVRALPPSLPLGSGDTCALLGYMRGVSSSFRLFLFFCKSSCPPHLRTWGRPFRRLNGVAGPSRMPPLSIPSVSKGCVHCIDRYLSYVCRQLAWIMAAVCISSYVVCILIYPILFLAIPTQVLYLWFWLVGTFYLLTEVPHPDLVLLCFHVVL